MAKWIEYLLKKKPADEDMLMLEEAETHNNKRVSFSGIADWLIEKMKKNNLISGALRFKGTAAYADLPGKGAAENDYYYCTDGDGTLGPGYYAWNGASWIWIGSNDKGIDSTLQVEGAAAEASATGTAIASLKEEVKSKIIDTVGKNKYNPDASDNGFIDTGGNINISYPDLDWVTSEFIKVEPGTYTLSNNGTEIKLSRYIIYNSERKILSVELENTTSNVIIKNDGYIRFSTHSTLYTKAQFEKGSEPTAFEPYDFKRLLSDAPYITDADVAPFNEYLLYNDESLKYDLAVGKNFESGTMTQNGVVTDGAYGNYKHCKIYISECATNQLLFVNTFEADSGFIEILHYKEDGTPLSGSVYSPIGVPLDNGRLYNLEKIPENTSYMIVNFYANREAHIYQYKDNVSLYSKSFVQKTNKKLEGLNEEVEKVKKETIEKVKNIWCGKKVVWLGTSISFGQHANTSYAYVAADILGFNLINTSFPGISLDVDSDTDTWTSALSIAEQAKRGLIIPDSPDKYYPQHGMPNDYYRTYEHIFSDETSDADLYVFAVLPNNRNWATTDWDIFDKQNWKYTDGSSFESHRSTFLGALLFMMNKMYESNPNARMIFCVDLDGSSNVNGLPLLEKVSEAFNIPIVNLWKKVQYNPKTKELIRYTDGIHLNDYAHIHMGYIMAGEMLLIH